MAGCQWESPNHLQHRHHCKGILHWNQNSITSVCITSQRNLDEHICNSQWIHTLAFPRSGVHLEACGTLTEVFPAELTWSGETQLFTVTVTHLPGRGHLPKLHHTPMGLCSCCCEQYVQHSGNMHIQINSRYNTQPICSYTCMYIEKYIHTTAKCANIHAYIKV